MERKGRGGHLTQGPGIVYSAVGVLVSVSQVLLVTRVELETRLREQQIFHNHRKDHNRRL